jgi:CheY-like chemotaxis protein
LRILLVEDHDDTRRTLARLIERWGHSVQTAASVAEALQLATDERLDLPGQRSRFTGMAMAMT